MINRNILKGICEELEFETEIGYSPAEFKVECKSNEPGNLELVIKDTENWNHVTICSVKIGELDNGKIGMRISKGSSSYLKQFNTLGNFVDDIDSAVSSIKDFAKTMIKRM